MLRVIRKIAAPIPIVGPVIRETVRVVEQVTAPVTKPLEHLVAPVTKSIERLFKKKKEHRVEYVASVSAEPMGALPVPVCAFAVVDPVDVLRGDATQLHALLPQLSVELAAGVASDMVTDRERTEYMWQLEINNTAGTLQRLALRAWRDAATPADVYHVQAQVLTCSVALPSLRDTSGRARGLTPEEGGRVEAALTAASIAFVAGNPACNLLAQGA
jgi:hypothetical protein